MLINFPFQYQVRFTTVSDGNDFAAEHHAYIDWINTSDEFNRAHLFCQQNIYSSLRLDERVLQFNFLKD